MHAVSKLADQVPVASWRAATHNRELPNEMYARQLLVKMVEHRPPPSFPLHQHIVSFVFDQTYAAKGRGSGAGSTHTNAVGRIIVAITLVKV